MKNITNLCIDLQEGKINKKDFLREARRTFPNYITNVNTFEDTIKIFKAKNLIAEGCNCESQLDEIRPPESEEEERDAMDSRINTSPIDNEPIGINLDPEIAAPSEQDIEVLKNLDQWDEEEEDLWNGEDDIDPAGGRGPWSHLEEAKEPKFKPVDTKYDGSKSEYSSIEELDPLELQIGMRYEKSCDVTGNADKWMKKVKTNLSKNSRYYTQLSMAGWDDKKLPTEVKKRTDLAVEMDKKMSNTTDKNNKMVTPKGIEKDKASANKAKKETVKPVPKVKEFTQVAKRAKGIKGVMDKVGGKMKKVKALNELGINNPRAPKPQQDLDELQIKGYIKNSIQSLINSKFPSESQNIRLQGEEDKVILKYNYWNRLPENILSILKEKYNIEGGDVNNKIYYELTPKISNEMMNEIKKRIKNLFKK